MQVYANNGTPLVGQFECANPLAEFAECGTGVGTCSSGLTCKNLSLLSVSLCVHPCDPTAANTCGATSYCQLVSATPTDGICWPVSGRGEPCLPAAPAEACVGATNLVCQDTGIGVSLACEAVCDGAAVNSGQATCAAGEQCLAGFFVEIQQGPSGDVTCTTPGIVDNCDGPGQYSCRSINTGGAQPENLCARLEGKCGDPVNVQTNLAAAALDTVISAKVDLCRRPDLPRYCEPLANAPASNPARVECTETSTGFITGDANGDPIACTDAVDCALIGRDCIDWGGSVGPACGYIASICVAWCENFDGTQTYNCPSGQACTGVPDQLDIVLQRVSGNLVTCTTDTNCDTGAGNACIIGLFSSGDYCGRPRRACQ